MFLTVNSSKIRSPKTSCLHVREPGTQLIFLHQYDDCLSFSPRFCCSLTNLATTMLPVSARSSTLRAPWRAFASEASRLQQQLRFGVVVFSLLAISGWATRHVFYSTHTVQSPGPPSRPPVPVLTVIEPIERYGLPVKYGADGSVQFDFPSEIKRVIFEVGLLSNPLYCNTPSREPDLFVIGWEANIVSWKGVYDRCLNASNGKYVALPFAAADSPTPLLWNTAAAKDACASRSAWNTKEAVEPAGWIQDPLQRATARCMKLVDAGTPIRLWDKDVAPAEYGSVIQKGMAACSLCRDKHMVGRNTPQRIGVVSFESVLAAIPDHIRVVLAKIDAQGADLAVFQSAGRLSKRIEKVHLEVQDLTRSDPDFLYNGPLVSNKEEMERKMNELGFPFVKCEVNNCACLEYNCYFTQVKE